jgi:RimJ/RimL family protein N-acetyltransferase
MRLPTLASDGVVRLRPLRPDDVAAYVGAFADDPDLARDRGLERVPDEAAVLSWMEVTDDFAELAIADAQDALVGSVMLYALDWRHKRGELGYWLVPAARGRGLATRALRLAVRWMFADLALERAQLVTTPDNAGSLAVARRAGFAQEGLLRGRDIEDGERIDDSCSPVAVGFRTLTARRALDSPRHLAFDLPRQPLRRRGAEAERVLRRWPEGPACMRHRRGDQDPPLGRPFRIAEGLASYANTPNNDQSIARTGSPLTRRPFGFITNGGPTEPRTRRARPIPARPAAAPNDVATCFGQLLRLRRTGSRSRSPISGVRARRQPDGCRQPEIDSNPSTCVRRPAIVESDPGGNAIDPFGRSGHSTPRVAPRRVFRTAPGSQIRSAGPPIDMQRCPRSVVLGPTTILQRPVTGFPFRSAARNDYRVDPRTGAVSVVAERLHEHHGSRVSPVTGRCMSQNDHDSC